MSSVLPRFLRYRVLAQSHAHVGEQELHIGLPIQWRHGNLEGAAPRADIKPGPLQIVPTAPICLIILVIRQSSNRGLAIAIELQFDELNEW